MLNPSFVILNEMKNLRTGSVKDLGLRPSALRLRLEEVNSAKDLGEHIVGDPSAPRASG